MWVVGKTTFDRLATVNMDNVAAMEVGDDWVEFHLAKGRMDLRKTSDLMFQLWSAIPGLSFGQHSQPDMPSGEGSAEYDNAPPLVNDYAEVALAVGEPFRITGLGLYETLDGRNVRIHDKDSEDPDLPWVTDDLRWYSDSGEWCGKKADFNIVKLIKLDEVQP